MTSRVVKMLTSDWGILFQPLFSTWSLRLLVNLSTFHLSFLWNSSIPISFNSLSSFTVYTLLSSCRKLLPECIIMWLVLWFTHCFRFALNCCQSVLLCGLLIVSDKLQLFLRKYVFFCSWRWTCWRPSLRCTSSLCLWCPVPFCLRFWSWCDRLCCRVMFASSVMFSASFIFGTWKYL